MPITFEDRIKFSQDINALLTKLKDDGKPRSGFKDVISYKYQLKVLSELSSLLPQKDYSVELIDLDEDLPELEGKIKGFLTDMRTITKGTFLDANARPSSPFNILLNTMETTIELEPAEFGTTPTTTISLALTNSILEEDDLKLTTISDFELLLTLKNTELDQICGKNTVKDNIINLLKKEPDAFIGKNVAKIKIILRSLGDDKRISNIFRDMFENNPMKIERYQKILQNIYLTVDDFSRIAKKLYDPIFSDTPGSPDEKRKNKELIELLFKSRENKLDDTLRVSLDKIFGEYTTNFSSGDLSDDLNDIQIKLIERIKNLSGNLVKQGTNFWIFTTAT